MLDTFWRSVGNLSDTCWIIVGNLFDTSWTAVLYYCWRSVRNCLKKSWELFGYVLQPFEHLFLCLCCLQVKYRWNKYTAHHRLCSPGHSTITCKTCETTRTHTRPHMQQTRTSYKHTTPWPSVARTLTQHASHTPRIIMFRHNNTSHHVWSRSNTHIFIHTYMNIL